MTSATDFSATISTIQSELSALQSKLAAWQRQLVDPKVLGGLEQLPWLVGGGTVANSAGNKATAQALQAQPGIQCASFTIVPQGSNADAYYYKKLGADPNKTTFEYAVSFLFPTAADAEASQALELDLQQVIGGLVFNFGWQFDFAENAVRIWNRAANEAKPNTGWQSIDTPCPRWPAGQWMRIVVEAHRDAASVSYDGITVNGLRFPLTTSLPIAKLKLADMLNIAIQLDSNSKGESYRVMVDDVSLVVS